MKLQIILILPLMALTATSQTLTLTSSHTEVLPFTTANVTLDCQLSESSDRDVFVVSSLRILKFQWDLMGWRPLAEIRDNENTVRFGQDRPPSITAAGNLGQGDTNSNHVEMKQDEGSLEEGRPHAFLRVVWSVAGTQTAGRYRCDVNVFTHGYDSVWRKSLVVDLKEANPMMTRDLYKMLMKQEAETSKRFDNQQLEVKQVKESVENETRELLEMVNKLEDEMSGMRDVQSLLTGLLEFWPEGSYGLAMPREGCPADRGVKWVTGYRKHHTESKDRNHDLISDGNHFQTPSLQRDERDNFIYQHFCMVGDPSVGPVWPKGSYCILQSKDTSCPPGFSSGCIHWDEEDTDSKSSSSGQLPRGSYGNSAATICYCCRSDGPAESRVYLPTSKPFYLYMYEGTCQRVLHMAVTEEFILFDTENGSNQDSFNSTHPGGDFEHGLKLKLCYYTPM